MILIDRFLSDEQDPKAVEKVLGKLNDMLSNNEELIYMAVQKKPAVNLFPDCIAVSNKRIFYCEPGNFGITMNLRIFHGKVSKRFLLKRRYLALNLFACPCMEKILLQNTSPKYRRVNYTRQLTSSWRILKNSKDKQNWKKDAHQLRL